MASRKKKTTAKTTAKTAKPKQAAKKATKKSKKTELRVSPIARAYAAQTAKAAKTKMAKAKRKAYTKGAKRAKKTTDRAKLVAAAKKKLAHKEKQRAAVKRGPLIVPTNYEEVKTQHAKLVDIPMSALRQDEANFLWIYTKTDKSVARHPSSLRWDKHAETLIKRLEKFQGDQIAFENLAEDIADDYDVDVREVYTLFWSH